jgi:hypothetical protein
VALDTTGLNAYAFANGLPSSSFVSAAFGGHPTIAAAFGSAGATVLGAGAQGAFYSTGGIGSHTYSSSIDWDFDTTNLSGDLLVGLLDHASFGADFDSLIFTITEDGMTLVNQAFPGLTSAESYFNDRVLDLGTFAHESDLDLVFSFDLTASSAGDGFGEDFIFGAASSQVIPIPPGQVPEPGTLGIFASGFVAAMLWRRRMRMYTLVSTGTLRL